MFGFSRNAWVPVINPLQVYNGIGTSNRHPYVFGSWIEYWRGITETYHDDVRCSACGCKMSSWLTDNEIKTHNAQHPTDEIRRAVGAHVEFVPDSKIYNIVPLCDKCNKEGQPVTLRKGTKVVPEISARIK